MNFTPKEVEKFKRALHQAIEAIDLDGKLTPEVREHKEIDAVRIMHDCLSILGDRYGKQIHSQETGKQNAQADSVTAAANASV